ncbi:unnamed protein product [Paramecium pentaurelia]|uniref:Transmembrane protein n=1 Tax=Paramecium pentaurelia TaxID=43138 RepID=A0A8S1WZF6_9CILI|nr:unnamed protein product [Paramecium pentaurelia]
MSGSHQFNSKYCKVLSNQVGIQVFSVVIHTQFYFFLSQASLIKTQNIFQQKFLQNYNLEIGIICSTQEYKNSLKYIIQAKIYKCLLGEQRVDNGCQICESNQDFYSGTYNSINCFIFDKEYFRRLLQIKQSQWKDIGDQIIYQMNLLYFMFKNNKDLLRKMECWRCIFSVICSCSTKLRKFQLISFQIKSRSSGYSNKMLLNYLWIFSFILSLNISFSFQFNFVNQVRNQSYSMANNLYCYFKDKQNNNKNKMIFSSKNIISKKSNFQLEYFIFQSIIPTSNNRLFKNCFKLIQNLQIKFYRMHDLQQLLKKQISQCCLHSRI